MKRRVIVVAVAVMASVMTPLLSRAATPCAPGSVAVNGSAPVTTACATGGSYTTNFDLTENPISEGGRWAQQGGVTGLDWSNVRTSGGIAYATQTGFDGYNDSIALLSGFGANQRISAVVSFTGSISSNTGSHEVELILRGSYGPHTQRLYECNLGYSSTGYYMQIIRMNGAIGDYTDIGITVTGTPAIKNGDVMTAEIIGNQISVYLNGTLMQKATDSTYSSGQPGIGFFWRGSENVTDIAFSSVTATSL